MCGWYPRLICVSCVHTVIFFFSRLRHQSLHERSQSDSTQASLTVPGWLSRRCVCSPYTCQLYHIISAHTHRIHIHKRTIHSHSIHTYTHAYTVHTHSYTYIHIHTLYIHAACIDVAVLILLVAMLQMESTVKDPWRLV